MQLPLAIFNFQKLVHTVSTHSSSDIIKRRQVAPLWLQIKTHTAVVVSQTRASTGTIYIVVYATITLISFCLNLNALLLATPVQRPDTSDCGESYKAMYNAALPRPNELQAPACARRQAQLLPDRIFILLLLYQFMSE